MTPMSKPWPKATPESERAPRQRSETKALFRLGDTVVEADDIDALRRESGMHRAPERRESASADDTGAPAQKANVLLWFAEIEEPVRAHAELSGSRLTLRAPLSLLEIGSQLHYTMIDSGAAASARVQRVALAADPGQSVPVLEVELLTDASGIDTTGFNKLEATDSTATDRYASVEPDPNDTLKVPPVFAPPPSRSGRWLGLLCAGAIGVAGGAAAIRWSDYEQAQRSAAARARAAREAAAAAAAAATAEAPILFRVVPDELARPAATPPSLLLHEVLPALDAIASGLPARAAAQAAPSAPAADGKPATDGERLPRVTVDDQRTTIVIPMRGNGDGLRATPTSTPGVLVTLPKAFALIPPGSHEPARGLARSIRLRKFASGTQVRIAFRSMAVRPRVVYDPAVGVEITLQRTW